MTEIQEIVNKTRVFSDINFWCCENYSYDESYIAKMWNFFCNKKGATDLKTLEKDEDFKPNDGIYKGISPFFELLYESKHDIIALHFVPNHTKQVDVVILKTGRDFHMVNVLQSSKHKQYLNEFYKQEGNSGNFIAIYFSK